jgi:hypothetical protein
MTTLIIALNALINDEKGGAITYAELLEKCKASTSLLDINSNEDMLMPLFETALLADVYQLAYLESTGVWANDQLNGIIDSVTDTIYCYAKKGTFNDVPFERKRNVYQNIFGWDISLLGFPKR